MLLQFRIELARYNAAGGQVRICCLAWSMDMPQLYTDCPEGKGAQGKHLQVLNTLLPLGA